MVKRWAGLLLCLVGLVALLAMSTVSVTATPQKAAPYAVFDHNGRDYYVHAAQREGTWKEAVAFCDSLEWNGKWRLPTLDEAISMRNGWEGNDPFDIDQPDICQGYPHPGIPELWTGTECDECSGGRGAYTIHPSDVTILTDAHTKNVCSHEDDPIMGKYCCLVKENYGSIHACPVARCVQPQGYFGECEGDFVAPFGERDFFDLLQVLKYVKANDMRGDLTGDGVVDGNDTLYELRLVMYAPMCPDYGGMR